ncbi:cytochrome c maturation protein CcmE [Ramlibacter sp. USB13]|uniref:Cytochrome c-type biogenesis protein CcmE n=1 Tax=Ramlibacter cellulosilyticus TaxID=2764187 RepID=A0A923MT24_9BURK|nr:cytochrome c maturation protein CcmE [Ramlibacter cellulosilyticus]MBC5784109.1 cytochrome c maturation protein CcmE [Ramlibacter cellulosilyticus]
MSPARRRRLLLLLAIVASLGVAAALVLSALRDNLLFFYTPAQLQAMPSGTRQVVRLGGMVEAGSVQREAQGLKVRFVVADGQARIPVEYEGLLPDLFRESRGVVTSGRLGAQGVFVAHEVLAKHEETYAAPAPDHGAAARPPWVKAP